MTPHSETPTNAMNASEGKEVDDQFEDICRDAERWVRAVAADGSLVADVVRKIRSILGEAVRKERLRLMCGALDPVFIVENLRSDSATQAATIASLQATIAELRKDSERYQFVRGDANDGEFCVLVGGYGLLMREELDEAIDKALASPSTNSREVSK